MKDNGAKHIVVGFSQITTDSVLDLVEIPNQIAKEVGFKTWLGIDALDFDRYPAVGHPFADYWGVWVDTKCGGVACCFVMGGCSDGRPYPPPRQTPITKALPDMDPSLAYDVSEYGHQGYDPAFGLPDPDLPVQQQYTGTWAMYRPPSDPRMIGRFLARKVRMHLREE